MILAMDFGMDRCATNVEEDLLLEIVQQFVQLMMDLMTQPCAMGTDFVGMVNLGMVSVIVEESLTLILLAKMWWWISVYVRREKYVQDTVRKSKQKPTICQDIILCNTGNIRSLSLC
jgi:hypothetical protein